VACSRKEAGTEGPADQAAQTAEVAPSTIAAAGKPVPLDAKLAVPVAPAVEPTAESIDARLKKSASRLSAADYDPAALAKSLGGDYKASFEFVRDRVRYEAYAGVLRDGDGALAARAGNSLDRSRLLAQMLRANGVRVRYASCQLPDEQAAAIFQHMFVAPPAGAAEAAKNQGEFLDRVVQRARRDYPVIRGAVVSRLASGGAQAREQALKDIRTHIWVQANVDGSWVDLDSAHPNAEAGKAYCSASSTVDSIPNDRYQRIAIRVVVEHVIDSVLQTDTMLEAEFAAVDLIETPVFLTHARVSGQSGGLGLGAGAAGADAKWAPVLMVGDDAATGQAFAFEHDATDGGTFVDAFGAGGGVSAFIAEWLEVEILLPDGRKDVTRRMLVDRGGSAWRNSENVAIDALRPLDSDAEGPLAPRAVHNLVFSAGHQDLLAFAEGIRWVAALEGSAQGLTTADSLYPFALRSRTLHLWSDQVIVPSLNDTAGIRFYPDTPRLTIVSAELRKDGQLTQSYDLRRDRINGVARDPSMDALVLDRKLWFAALQGALEHESGVRDSLAMADSAAGVRSTSALLGPGGAVALAPDETDRVASLTSHPDKAADLTVALRSSHFVVVPRAALGDTGWGYWEISRTGDVRAILEGGLLGSGGIPLPPPRSGKTIFIPDDPPEPPPPRKPRPSDGAAERAARKTSPGTEYTMLLQVAQAVVAGVTVLAAVVHHNAKRQAALELEAWLAAEEARHRQFMAQFGH
jgi:hypothetical protein